MTELDLGPNGALLYAMEYIEAQNAGVKPYGQVSGPLPGAPK